MRRNDREIKDLSKIILMMKASDVCRVAFFDEEYPYIVPLNFGIDEVKEKITLYFHGAMEGKKLDLMKRNPHVSFEMDSNHEIIYAEEACKCTMNYISVMGTGILSVVKDCDKKAGLIKILEQYGIDSDSMMNEKALSHTTIMRLDVTSISGKAH